MMAISDRLMFLFHSMSPSAVERSIRFSALFKARLRSSGSHGMLFSSILRLRGMEANASSGYAEGFYCRKAILGMEI